MIQSFAEDKKRMPERMVFSNAGTVDPRMESSGISVVVPMRNEKEHIKECLDSLLQQSYEKASYEIIVVDGRSSDGCSQIVQGMQSIHPSLLFIDNPSGITPVAMNLGIRKARNKFIVIASAHASYSPDFLLNCVKKLLETGADAVGGPVTTIPADDSFGARLVAAILSSPFGVGNSKFRTGGEEGFVDTVPFGAFRREIFDRVGMYNERLVRNQDNELNARIRKAGGKIYLTPALTTRYHPVKSLLGLLKYAFKTSRWHIFTLRENREAMGLRHLAPVVFLILLLLLLASSASAIARSLLIGMMGVYLLTGFYFSLRAKTEGNWDVALIQPFASFCFHVAYGAGTLFGVRYLFQHPPIRPIRPGLPIQR